MTRPVAIFAFVAVGVVGPVEPARAQELAPPPALPPPSYVPGQATSGSVPAPRNSDDEVKDSGLGLEWVWLGADVGASYVALDSFNANKLQIQTTKSGGPAFSVGAGVRLLSLTLGLRARELDLSDFSLWELDAEIALHSRIDRLDPYVGVRGGYAFDGSLSSGATQAVNGTSPSGVSVHGENVGLALGCDYYFNHFLSLGVDLNGEVLILQRPPATPPSALTNPAVLMLLSPADQAKAQAAAQVYRESGSSVGMGLTGAAHLGLHF